MSEAIRRPVTVAVVSVLLVALIAAIASVQHPTEALAADKASAVVCGNDFGRIYSVGSGWVSGRWYNCTGTAVDYVKIQVDNGSDGRCTYVSPGYSKYYAYDPTYWNYSPWVDHGARWVRC